MARSLTSGPSDSPSLSSLLPALSAALERVGSAPIEFSVSLSDSKEVVELRERVEALEASLAAERAIRVRAENLFASESYLNNELIELCRENGVPVPRHFFLSK